MSKAVKEIEYKIAMNQLTIEQTFTLMLREIQKRDRTIVDLTEEIRDLNQSLSDLEF